MINIETKTNWPLISNANVILQTSVGEAYILSAQHGKMNFSLTGKDLKVTFTIWQNKILAEEYVAKQGEEIIARIKCNNLMGPFGEFVFVKDKWFNIPNVVRASIKEYGFFVIENL